MSLWPPTTFSDLTASAAVTVAGLSAFFAIRTFRQNVNVRRAELLKHLYSMFYETQTYSRMRHLLDYRPEPEFSRLRTHVEDSDGGDADFGIYLNFFEYVAGLWSLRQLSTSDVEVLFHYYLKELKFNPKLQFARNYMNQWSFVYLGALLEKISEKKQAHR